jgi:hypothetical protein
MTVFPVVIDMVPDILLAIELVRILLPLCNAQCMCVMNEPIEFDIVIVCFFSCEALVVLDNMVKWTNCSHCF